ncbi:hypothetical protein FHG87_008956 [Trinorchestia longiramus]|nr:hypothetical protein FHG87_008956 [Trinorchestia longiramus]
MRIQKESWSSVVQLRTELLLIDLEDRFGMDKANSVATPVDVNADLVTTSDEVEECDEDLYQSATVGVAVTSLLRRPACNEEYEQLRREVNRDLYEKILVMKTESVQKYEVGSSFLDMDDLIQAGCFLRDGVHLSQERETKLS